MASTSAALSSETLQHDPELRPDKARIDLHSLRAADPGLNEFSEHIQREAAIAAVASLQRDGRRIPHERDQADGARHDQRPCEEHGAPLWSRTSASPACAVINYAGHEIISNKS